jgi:hypothetical protein
MEVVMLNRMRLYFMLPDVASANAIADELLLARIEDRRMHFLARRGTNLGALHEATVLQKTDVRHGAAVGMMGGAVLGLAAGTLVLLFPPTGHPMHLVVVLATTLVGAVLGMWASTLAASAIPNSHLARFSDDIERGGVLLMVDVTRNERDKVERIVTTRHPEAVAHGYEPTIPAFP